MNKNSKANRRLVQKKKQDLTFDITKTMPNSTALGIRKHTINYGCCDRKSEKGKPKVAANGCKNPNGPNIREQMEIFYSPWLNS